MQRPASQRDRILELLRTHSTPTGPQVSESRELKKLESLLRARTSGTERESTDASATPGRESIEASATTERESIEASATPGRESIEASATPERESIEASAPPACSPHPAMCPSAAHPRRAQPVARGRWRRRAVLPI